MERIRGGRVGLHSVLRQYTIHGVNGEGDFDDPRLWVGIHAPSVLPSRWIIRELRKGHSPVPVGVVFSQNDIEDRKRFQLMRAKALHGTPDETPVWRRYYQKHFSEILALN